MFETAYAPYEFGFCDIRFIAVFREITKTDALSRDRPISCQKGFDQYCAINGKQRKNGLS